jgi:hypothetical protein
VGRRSGSQRSALLLSAGLTVLSVMAVDAGPADPFSLPLETPPVVTAPPVTVKTPSVTVETPPVTVKAPPVTVKVPPVTGKTPPVTVKTPSVPVKTPSVPVQTPSVPAKTPTVTAKAPTAPTVSTESGKAPSITVHSPSVSTKAPGVSVKPGVSVAAGSTGTKVPGVSVAVRSSSSATPSAAGRIAGELSAGAAQASGGNSVGATPNGAGSTLGGYGSPGPGYGQLPASEGAPGTKARARIASRERKLKATVARERACLGSLPEQQQQLLVLRTGLGQPMPLSRRATAARLHVGSARFAQLEAQALHELNDASAHGCRQTGVVVAKVLTFLGSSFGSPHARGGVEAVRYEAAPRLTPPAASSGDTGLLGTKLSPVASDAILALAALFVLALATMAMIADATGNGPRHAQWRRHLRNHIRNWR